MAGKKPSDGEGENDETLVRQASGAYADVYLFGDALSEFRKLKATKGDQDAQRASVNLPKYFKRFADAGPSSLTEKMFKKLRAAKDGLGNELAIFEFKNFQVRIYGVIRDFRGKRSFLGTACDPKKKTDKADPAMLTRAAKEAGKVKE